MTPAGRRPGWQSSWNCLLWAVGRAIEEKKETPDETSDEADDAILRLFSVSDAESAFKMEGRNIDEWRSFDLHIQAVNPLVA